jgi:hypothetical protein
MTTGKINIYVKLLPKYNFDELNTVSILFYSNGIKMVTIPHFDKNEI